MGISKAVVKTGINVLIVLAGRRLKGVTRQPPAPKFPLTSKTPLTILIALRAVVPDSHISSLLARRKRRYGQVDSRQVRLKVSSGRRTPKAGVT